MKYHLTSLHFTSLSVSYKHSTCIQYALNQISHAFIYHSCLAFKQITNINTNTIINSIPSFDAADADESFDDAIKKVKGDEKK